RTDISPRWKKRRPATGGVPIAGRRADLRCRRPKRRAGVGRVGFYGYGVVAVEPASSSPEAEGSVVRGITVMLCPFAQEGIFVTTSQPIDHSRAVRGPDRRG